MRVSTRISMMKIQKYLSPTAKLSLACLLAGFFWFGLYKFIYSLTQNSTILLISGWLFLLTMFGLFHHWQIRLQNLAEGAACPVGSTQPQTLSQELGTLFSKSTTARLMYHGISSGILIRDSGGRLVNANAAACALLGLSLDQLFARESPPEGWSAHDVEGRPLSPADLRELVVPSHPHDSEFIISLAGQKKVWLSCHSDPVLNPFTNKLLGVVSTLTDITDRKLFHLQEALLKEVNQRVLNAEPLNEILHSVCSHIVSNLDYAWAWVGKKEPDGTVSFLAASGLDWQQFAALPIRWDDTPEGESPVGLAIRTGETQVHDLLDSQNFKRFRPFIDKQQLAAAASFPLNYQGATIGTLTLYSRIPHFFNPLLVRRLELLATQLAFSIIASLHYEQLTRYRLLAEHTKDILLFLSPDGQILDANLTAIKKYGYSKEELLTMTLHDLRTIETIPEIPMQLHRALAGPTLFETWQKDKNGNPFPVEVTSQGTILEGKHVILNIVRDITDRKKAEKALYESEQRYRKMFDHMSNPAIVFTVQNAGENFIFQEFNPAAEVMYDIPRDAVIGESLIHLFPQPEHRNLFSTIRTVWQTGHSAHYPLSYNHSPLMPGWWEMYIYQLPSGELVGIYENVTDKQNLIQQLSYQSQHDALTGLPNRLMLNAHLTQALNHAHRHGTKLGLLLIDLDRFKLINDTQGHAFGDALLQSAASRLQGILNPQTLLSRQGGDEFSVVLTDIADQSEAVSLAHNILKNLADPFIIAEREVFVTASIGIALYPLHGPNVETLIKNAETAMYYSKEHGRNNFEIYQHPMHGHASEKMAIENELRRALEKDEFILHYQPQIDINHGDIVGVEALLRWKSPQRGLVSPSEFIPIAEETGLIVPLGEWVLRNACQQIAHWKEQNQELAHISINLSPRQFRQPNLVQIIKTTLEEYNLSASSLELEITESLAMEDANFTIALLKELKALGIRTSIDDFGTGFSSLNYLRLLPLDTLKIDQSFVRDIGINANGAEIVKTIIRLGKNLNLKVIAEGVETKEQLHFLKEHSCDEIQGYLFSKPVSAPEFTQLFEQQEQS